MSSMRTSPVMAVVAAFGLLPLGTTTGGTLSNHTVGMVVQEAVGASMNPVGADDSEIEEGRSGETGGEGSNRVVVFRSGQREVLVIAGTKGGGIMGAGTERMEACSGSRRFLFDRTMVMSSSLESLTIKIDHSGKDVMRPAVAYTLTEVD